MIPGVKSNTYLPSEGERLEGYAERLRSTLSDFEEWSSKHSAWFTHYGPGPCWICDLLLVMRYTCDVLNDICNETKIKHMTLTARHAKGATNMDYFEFKIGIVK